jgi:hypothetical protein
LDVLAAPSSILSARLRPLDVLAAPSSILSARLRPLDVLAAPSSILSARLRPLDVLAICALFISFQNASSYVLYLSYFTLFFYHHACLVLIFNLSFHLNCFIYLLIFLTPS